MEEYKQWLEQQIERCLNDKDLQREHWAFCKAYEKFTALCQPPVSGEVCDNCGDGKPLICAKCYETESNFRKGY